MIKTQFLIELAKPDKNGKSSWVSVSDFIGKYKSLQLGNGGSWCRKSLRLVKKYIGVFDKTVTSGNSIDGIHLNRFNTEKSFNKNIRQNIKDFYVNQNRVMLGINGNSESTKIEIAHKDSRKDSYRISTPAIKKLLDFQPLSKTVNDVKRQICKRCKETNKHWNAKNLKGNPFEFYFGDENYTEEVGCKGCYQYDPVEYRKTVVIKVSKMAAKEAVDAVFKKLYLEE